jgi:hypothetical protein
MKEATPRKKPRSILNRVVAVILTLLGLVVVWYGVVTVAINNKCRAVQTALDSHLKKGMSRVEADEAAAAAGFPLIIDMKNPNSSDVQESYVAGNYPVPFPMFCTKRVVIVYRFVGGRLSYWKAKSAQDLGLFG